MVPTCPHWCWWRRPRPGWSRRRWPRHCSPPACAPAPAWTRPSWPPWWRSAAVQSWIRSYHAMHGKKDDDGIDGRFLVYFSIEIVTIILQLSVLRVQLCVSGWLLWHICFALLALPLSHYRVLKSRNLLPSNVRRGNLQGLDTIRTVREHFH